VIAEFAGVARSRGRPHVELNPSRRQGSAFEHAPYESFSLGGPLQLSAYRIGEFSGRRMTFARLMYYNRALPLPDLIESGVYLRASLEAGRILRRFDGFPHAGTVTSASVFLGADSFLGPAYLGLGFPPGGRNSIIYVLLGVP
jgi:NTE family protein